MADAFSIYLVSLVDGNVCPLTGPLRTGTHETDNTVKLWPMVRLSEKMHELALPPRIRTSLYRCLFHRAVLGPTQSQWLALSLNRPFILSSNFMSAIRKRGKGTHF